MEIAIIILSIVVAILFFILLFGDREGIYVLATITGKHSGFYTGADSSHKFYTYEFAVKYYNSDNNMMVEKIRVSQNCYNHFKEGDTITVQV